MMFIMESKWWLTQLDWKTESEGSSLMQKMEVKHCDYPINQIHNQYIQIIFIIYFYVLINRKSMIRLSKLIKLMDLDKNTSY